MQNIKSRDLYCVADRPIGLATLGGSMFTRGKSLEHWQEVLKFQKTYIQRWHKIQDLMTPQPEITGTDSGGNKRISIRKNRSRSASVGTTSAATPRPNRKR